MEDGTTYQPDYEPKREINLIGIIAIYVVGIVMGITASIIYNNMAKDPMVTCEQRITTSVISGEPVMFINGDPVLSRGVLRKDGSVVYNFTKVKK